MQRDNKMTTPLDPASTVMTKTRARNKAGQSSTSPARLKVILERQVQALEYRKMGYTFDQIANALGYAGAPGAYAAVQRSLLTVLRAPAEDVLQIELLRLDALFSKPYQAALQGDLMALTGCLSVMARKAKLLGLDAPVKQELSGPGGGPIASQVHQMSDARLDAAAKRIAKIVSMASWRDQATTS
jgi:hypothetical protein